MRVHRRVIAACSICGSSFFVVVLLLHKRGELGSGDLAGYLQAMEGGPWNKVSLGYESSDIPIRC